MLQKYIRIPKFFYFFILLVDKFGECNDPLSTSQNWKKPVFHKVALPSLTSPLPHPNTHTQTHTSICEGRKEVLFCFVCYVEISQIKVFQIMLLVSLESSLQVGVH
jgi:hypothetical protein